MESAAEIYRYHLLRVEFALVPVLAGICIPIRGLPLCWFWLDFAFAPAAALPLWLALRDIRRAEAGPDTE